jgi:hypothetical protein
MRVNVEKVLERDQKLSELDKRADDLQEGASQFQQQGRRRRNSPNLILTSVILNAQSKQLITNFTPILIKSY